MRKWLVGLVAGVLGLALGIVGDALPLVRGTWVHLGLVPAAIVAVTDGPWAGLLAGLLAGAAARQWPMAVAAGLWLALTGWLGQGWRERPGRTGFAMLASALVVLVPLLALGAGLGTYADAGQVLPLLKSLMIALLPTALLLGLIGWAARRFHFRATVAVAAVLLVLFPLASHPARRSTVPAAAGNAEAGYRAGFAAADISPNAEMLKAGVYLGGYGGRPGPATGVHDPIFFRVMALEQGQARLIFVQTDTVGMGNRMYDRLRAAAVAAAGTEQVFVAATHSHAAPDLQGIWGGVPAAYEDFLVRQLGSAVTEAVSRLTPVQLVFGETRLQVARNRRGWAEVPQQMSVLQARTPSGQVVGTLVNFSVHPTVLPRTNMEISPDFVGAMLSAVESRYHGRALFFNGAQGDVVPTGSSNGSMYEQAEAYGRYLAEGASQAVAAAVPVAAGPVSVRTLALQAPLENWGFQLLMSAGILRYDVSHAGLLPGIRSRMSLIRLGPDVAMVTVPGEMVTRLWAQVEEVLPPGHRFVLGLTQDSLGYIITRDEWATGRNRDYEESVSVGPIMGPLVAETIRQLAR